MDDSALKDWLALGAELGIDGTRLRSAASEARSEHAGEVMSKVAALVTELADKAYDTEGLTGGDLENAVTGKEGYKAVTMDAIQKWALSKTMGGKVDPITDLIMKAHKLSEEDVKLIADQQEVNTLLTEQYITQVTSVAVAKQDNIRRRLAAMQVSSTIMAMMANQPQVQMEGGHIDVTTKVDEEMTAIEPSSQRNTQILKQQSERVTKYGFMDVQVSGTVNGLGEQNPKARYENAVISRLANGKAVAGDAAPGLANEREENAAYEYIWPGDVSMPCAAASPMITTIIGWLMHCASITRDTTEARTFEEWANAEVPVAIHGWSDGNLTSGLSTRDAVGSLTMLQHNYQTEIKINSDGSLYKMRRFAELLSGECNARDFPNPRQRWYMLTIPTRSNNQPALTAAALAMTTGLPTVKGGRGHMPMMAVAAACGVTYLSGAGASADHMSPALFNRTAFNQDDLLQLLGSLRDVQLGASEPELVAVLQNVACFIKPATRSHHDSTNTLDVLVPKLGVRNCEPVLDLVLKVSSGTGKQELTHTALDNGIAVMNAFYAIVETYAVGRSLLELEVASRGQLSLRHHDIEAYQADHAAALLMTARAEKIAGGAGAKQMNETSGISRLVEMNTVNGAMVGLAFTPTAARGSLWNSWAITHAKGCCYENANRRRLTKVVVQDWQDHEAAVTHLLETAQRGGATTLLNQGSFTQNDVHVGHVVDCGRGASSRLTDLATEVWHTDREMARWCMQLTKRSTHYNQDLEEAIVRSGQMGPVSDYADGGIVKEDLREHINRTAQAADAEQTPLAELVVPERTIGENPDLRKHATTLHRALLLGTTLAHMLTAAIKRANPVHQVQLKQAVAVGWWHGSHVNQVLRFGHKVNADKTIRLATTKLVTTKKVSPKRLDNIIGVINLHDMMRAAGVTLVLKTEEGTWSTLGHTLLGGMGMPAMSKAWDMATVLSQAGNEDSEHVAAALNQLLTGTLETDLLAKSKVSGTRSGGAARRAVASVFRATKRMARPAETTMDVPRAQLDLVGAVSGRKTGDTLLLGLSDESTPNRLVSEHDNRLLQAVERAMNLGGQGAYAYRGTQQPRGQYGEGEEAAASVIGS